MPVLKTWRGGKEHFSYEGSVETKTVIRYGEQFRWRATVTGADYDRLLRRFSEKCVPVGTSKDKPTPGSVGEWVKANINRSGLMSYIGPILIAEKYATKPKPGWISIKKFPN
jgi:hypothetical protein